MQQAQPRKGLSQVSMIFAYVFIFKDVYVTITNQTEVVGRPYFLMVSCKCILFTVNGLSKSEITLLVEFRICKWCYRSR